MKKLYFASMICCIMPLQGMNTEKPSKNKILLQKNVCRELKQSYINQEIVYSRLENTNLDPNFSEGISDAYKKYTNCYEKLELMEYKTTLRYRTLSWIYSKLPQ